MDWRSGSIGRTPALQVQALVKTPDPSKRERNDQLLIKSEGLEQHQNKLNRNDVQKVNLIVSAYTLVILSSF
jgi:hypothetical protein